MNALSSTGQPRVTIVGGGFTGAAVAWHLAQASKRLSVSVLEPKPFLGGGVAYSSVEPSHRINVPAVRMSMKPDDPDHFVRWLKNDGALVRDPEAVWKDGNAYPRRSVFGRYVAEHLAPYLDSGAIRHIRASVTHIARVGAAFAVETSDGEKTTADILVLAATHPLPGIPLPLAAIDGAPGFISDPYEPGILADIAPDASVLIVGSGLTSADTVAELSRRGHRGRILALSRHGLRSRGHPDVRREPFGDFTSEPASTALELLQRVRATIKQAEAENLTWHPVFDRLRGHGHAIWTALEPDERAKLVRRLRVFWDVHRFRIAPQVEAVLDRRQADGTFENIAAALVASNPEEDGLAVCFQKRGQRQAQTGRFDAVINTTGPAHGTILKVNPALKSLAEAGLIRRDRYGLGIETASDGRAIGRDGKAVRSLFIAGPLARGTVGELMGLPEVAQYASKVASEIGALLDAHSPAARQLPRPA